MAESMLKPEEEMKGYPVQSTVKMVEGKLSFNSESLDEIKGDSYVAYPTA